MLRPTGMGGVVVFPKRSAPGDLAGVLGADQVFQKTLLR